MTKILLDGMGGDHSPAVNVEGAVKALNSFDDLYITITGRQAEIEEQLKKYTYDSSRLEIVNADEVITCNESPTDAIKKKTESSMVKAFDLLKKGDGCAIISAGSTGAFLTGAVLKVGRIKGVKRPAFCPVLPTMKGSLVAICDSGANVDCNSFQLSQFAVMASLYMEKAYGVEKPRVALLNIGTEEIKGDMLRKETYEILKNMPEINFVGNMESRDLLSGNYDVVVCDGFAGNVLLKSTEGACLEILKMLKSVMTKSLKNKLGALLLKKDVYELKDYMDYNNYCGAVMIGTAKR